MIIGAKVSTKIKTMQGEIFPRAKIVSIPFVWSGVVNNGGEKEYKCRMKTLIERNREYKEKIIR